MNRSLFKKLAAMRVVEAQVLLNHRNYCGAYYLAGYAIECALKACIASKTKRYDFPDRQFVAKCYTHNIKDLAALAGLEEERKQLERADSNFAVNWAIVKDWDETKRYVHTVSRQQARELITSITEPDSGIMQWLQKHW